MLAPLAHDHDHAHLQTALRAVTDFRRALDCGAHVGTWARVLARRFDELIAVEPQRENYAALSAAVPGARCIRAAVSDAPGLTGLRPGMENTGQWHLAPGHEVPVITIDSLGLEHLGFLKLDVEGCELFALQGAAQTLARCRPVVLIEENGLCLRYGVPRGTAGAFLENMGARLAAVCNKDYLYVL